MKEGFVEFKQSTGRQTCLTPLHSLLHSTPHSTATEWWVNIWFFFYFQKAFDSLCLSSYIKKFQPFWLTFYARIFSSELFKRFKVRVAAILFQKICFRMKFIFFICKVEDMFKILLFILIWLFRIYDVWFEFSRFLSVEFRAISRKWIIISYNNTICVT